MRQTSCRRRLRRRRSIARCIQLLSLFFAAAASAELTSSRLRQPDKTMKNGKTCSSSCVEDETAIITCSNAHRSLERGGCPPPFKYTRGREGYKRNLDASGSVYRIPFIFAAVFSTFCATRLVGPKRPLTITNKQGNFLQFSEILNKQI